MGVRRIGAAFVSSALVVVAASAAEEAVKASLTELQRQVADTERAFARSMAERDLKAFSSFVAEEAVFLGQTRTLRGRPAVTAGWKELVEAAQAPFSWAPEQVEVLESGTLALSTGPVLDPQGQRIGTFSSIWRLEADRRWRVIFDRGCPACRCP